MADVVDVKLISGNRSIHRGIRMADIKVLLVSYEGESRESTHASLI